MSYVKKLEFGNYTLKFGNKKVLLDLFNEVVMPSFFEMKYIRHLENKGEYFFLDTNLIKLDDNPKNPVIGISGRIVKNTKLRRDQIFRHTEGIIEDKKELETAPSSTFLLILNNHRLILCKEVPGAPTIQNFESTSLYCLKQRHKEYVDELYKSQDLEDPARKKVTKKLLLENNPYPTLRITPLSDKQSLEDFINRFRHIDKLTIKLLPTNNEEIDNDGFWADFGKVSHNMNSKSAKVEFSNTKEGLDSETVYAQASFASNNGNSEINIKGSDNQGDTISGNNEDFSLTVELEELSRDTKQAAKVKYNQFKHLSELGIIAQPQVSPDTLDKVKMIFNKL